MTFDRLMRCGADQKQYLKVPINNQYLWLDNDLTYVDNMGNEPFELSPLIADDSTFKQDASPCSTDYYGPEATMFGFAEWLRRSGNYDRAITEYLRFQYSYPNSPNLIAAQKSIFICYYKRRLYNDAIKCGETLLGSLSSPYDDNDILFLLGTSYFQKRNYSKASEIFDNIYRCSGENANYADDQALLLMGLSAAYMLDWKKAEQSFLMVNDRSKYRSQALNSARLSREGYLSKRKKPALAGVLAIVPGLGYLYDGYPQTALSAFIINGVFIWGSIESYHNDQNGLGTMLSVVGIGWYAGNIYGSVTSARRYNRKQDMELLLKFDIPLEF